MPRPTKRPPPPLPPRYVQAELFPRVLVVDALDPRAVAGAHTRVNGVYLVREYAAGAPHRVFHDRHGWYCEEHGTACAVVPELRASLGA